MEILDGGRLISKTYILRIFQDIVLKFRLPLHRVVAAIVTLSSWTTKIGVAFGTSPLSRWLRYKYFLLLNGLPTAILNYRLPVTVGSIHNSATELLDHENVGVAVGTELLSCLEAEI